LASKLLGVGQTGKAPTTIPPAAGMIVHRMRHYAEANVEIMHGLLSHAAKKMSARKAKGNECAKLWNHIHFPSSERRMWRLHPAPTYRRKLILLIASDALKAIGSTTS
jgi:hypothetical protein